MIVLKKTSRLGRAQIERTGTARVGNRHEEPRSTNDRKADADQIGFDLGDPVQLLSGAHKGALGIVRWKGYSDRGGGPRIGVEVRKGADWVFVDADDAMAPSSSTRFQRR